MNKHLHRILLALILLFPAKALFAQKETLVIPGDFADPTIARDGNRYYAMATSSEWAPHFPIFTSTDLLNWKQVGYLFDKAPEWTVASFWAPEYFHHNNTWYVYYVARRKSDNVSCIGVATSKYPDHGFVDHGIVVAFGKESIDPFVYDDNGQLYISWKAYGLDQRPIEILASKLSADGFSLVGEPFMLLRDDKRVGLEGQSFLKKDGYYYLFHSVGDCCGTGCSYRIRVARAKDIHGPYEDDPQNPILKGDDVWKCTGHGTFVQTPDGKYYYLHHGYSKKSGVFTGRQGLLAQLIWPGKGEWPIFKEAKFAAGVVQKSTNKITDNFQGDEIAKAWQWDFRHAAPQLKQHDGKLYLSGTLTPNNQAGIALTQRPHTTNYTISVTVVNHNDALKGLTLYGDANSAVGVAVKGSNVEFWEIKDNKKTILNSAAITNNPVQLKIAVTPDLNCKVYCKQAGTWTELSNASKPYSIQSIAPWDRSARPGLIYNGPETEQAVFSGFELAYSAE